MISDISVNLLEGRIVQKNLSYVFLGLILIVNVDLVSAQSSLVELKQVLFEHLPKTPEGFKKDSPMFATPPLQAEQTFEVLQLYYQPLPPYSTISLKMLDYSMNTEFYEEQVRVSFDESTDDFIQKSESLLGLPAHIFEKNNEVKVSLFLGNYVYLEIESQGKEVSRAMLIQILEGCDLYALSSGLLEFKSAWLSLRKE